MRHLRRYTAPQSSREYKGRRRSRHFEQGARRERYPRRNPYRQNPKSIKQAALAKKLNELVSLGMDMPTAQELATDLSQEQVASSQAIYLLDWWKARLALLKVVETDLSPTEENAYIFIIKTYADKYAITDPHDLTLDDELQIDNFTSLRHFVHLATTNVYFSLQWPKLHRVTFTVPARWDYERAETHQWLGKLAKKKIPLTESLYGIDKNEPAMKLLRGAFIADPIGAETQTQIPLALIYDVEETRRPSDMIEFLTDLEENIKTDRFFTPTHHQPFMTFEDGKSWVVVDPADYAAEGNSLRDCGVGQHSNSSIAILSLRQAIPNTSPQQFKALLKAEVVFPSGTPRNAGYDVLKEKVGVVNQLRSFANQKPPPEFHRYIISLLEEGWIAHFVRPSYEPERIFWPTDLTDQQIEYLKKRSDYLFDSTRFFEKFKELNYPSHLRDQIMDGIEFPMSYVMEQLAALSSEDIRNSYSIASSGKIVRAALKRGAAQRKSAGLTPELAELLDQAEQRMLATETPEDVISYLSTSGAELSTSQIYQRLKDRLEFEAMEKRPSREVNWTDQEIRERRRQRSDHKRLWKVVLTSLQSKIERDDDDLAPLLEAARELLLRGISGNELLRAGVTLSISQVAHLLEEYIRVSQGPPKKDDDDDDDDDDDRFGGFVNEWHVIINTLRNMVKLDQDISPLMPLIKEIILSADKDQFQFSAANDLIALGYSENKPAVILTEKEIIKVFLDEVIYTGRSHAALVSLKQKLNSGSRKSMTKMLRAAQIFLSRVKDPVIAREALETVELPMKDVIAAVEAKSLNTTIRKTALNTLKKRFNRGDKYLRARAIRALEKLLLETKSKNFITSILEVFDGHQQKHHMISFFIRNRVEWLSEERNHTFLNGLFDDILEGSGSSSYSTTKIDSPAFHLYKDLALGNIIPDDVLEDDGHEIVLKTIYEKHFSDDSIEAAGKLLEVVLDRIIEDPEKLNSGMCSWYQSEHHSGGGWGRGGYTTHRSFANSIPLSHKLMKQFKALGAISRTSPGDPYYNKLGARRDCYLDLVLTVASKMNQQDKAKLFKIVSPLIEDMIGGEDSGFKKVIGRYLGYDVDDRRRRRNPLDTSGIICDFCGGTGVTEIHSHRPFLLGGRIRSQQMSCNSCSQLIASGNIRGMITQAANMLPKEMRKQARNLFRGIYQQFFDNLLNTTTIGPSDIFDLQMLRARSLDLKCAIRTGHPTLGGCNDLAFVEVNQGGWKKSCMVCATNVLGLSRVDQVILHPDIRNLRP